MTLEPEIAADLARARDEAIRHVRQGVLLVRRALRVGEAATSFIGGLPHLPSALVWPSRATGTGARKPLNFVAQIDLADVPRPRGTIFPPRGRLFFFADFSDERFQRGEHTAVLFDRAETAAAETTPPQDLPPFSPAGDAHGWLRAHHDRSRVERKDALLFHLFDTFYDRPYPKVAWSWRDFLLPRRSANDEELAPDQFFGPGVYEQMIDALRDEAVERATGRRRHARGYWFGRHSGFGAPGWPQTSIEAEYALMALAEDYRLSSMLPNQTCPTDRRDALRRRIDELILAMRSGTPRALGAEERRSVRLLVKQVRHARALIDHARRERPETSLRQFLRWAAGGMTSQVERSYPHAVMEILRAMPEPERYLRPELLDPWQELVLGNQMHAHQMFGHASSPQDAPHCYADHVLLLQIGGSATLGLPIMTDATIHYWITRKDLARGRFDCVEATWEAG